MARKFWLFFLFFFLLYQQSARAQQDTLVMVSGEILPGTIAAIDKGTLQFDSQNLGRLNIGTEKIAALISATYRDVVTTYGTKHFAMFGRGSEKGKVKLIMAREKLEVSADALFTTTNIAESKRDRLKGLVSAGLNYTESNRTLQINWGGQASYRTFRNTHSARYSGLINRQPEEINRRHDLTYDYNRNYNRGYFLYASGSIQQNTQLSVLFRGQAAGGGGKNLVRNRDVNFSVIAALNNNNEVTLENDAFSSLEALFGIRYSHYNIEKPRLDISSNFNYYRSLTETNRNRFDADVKLIWKILGDFSLVNGLLLSLDSRNPQTGEPQTDLVFTLSASYSF